MGYLLKINDQVALYKNGKCIEEYSNLKELIKKYKRVKTKIILNENIFISIIEVNKYNNLKKNEMIVEEVKNLFGETKNIIYDNRMICIDDKKYIILYCLYGKMVEELNSNFDDLRSKSITTYETEVYNNSKEIIKEENYILMFKYEQIEYYNLILKSELVSTYKNMELKKEENILKILKENEKLLNSFEIDNVYEIEVNGMLYPIKKEKKFYNKYNIKNMVVKKVAEN